MCVCPPRDNSVLVESVGLEGQDSREQVSVQLLQLRSPCDMIPRPPDGLLPSLSAHACRPPRTRQRAERITEIQTCLVSCKRAANSAAIPVINAPEDYVRFLVTT